MLLLDVSLTGEVIRQGTSLEFILKKREEEKIAVIGICLDLILKKNKSKCSDLILQKKKYSWKSVENKHWLP